MRRAPPLLLLLTLAAACGGPKVATTGPSHVELPATDGLAPGKAPGRPREAPPPSGAAKESPFPPVARTKLANGLDVAVVSSRSLPIVQVRLLVRAGSSYGTPPGVGEITAESLKDGGTRSMTSTEVLRRVETLGADLSADATRDAIVVAMPLTRDKLEEGVKILSEVVREPRFDPAELKKTKDRAIDDAEDAARSSGTWTAARIVWSELYPEKSPYHVRSLLPSQIRKIDLANVRDFHRRFFVPKNATLILAGDVDATAARELAERHFGRWTGGEPPAVEFAPPRPSQGTRVIIAHRPKSVQSDVYVAMLAPERRSDRWASIRVATQVLGGGVASRLFSDVRERRSLAYSTTAQISEVAHGEQPLVLYAGTESSKTAEAVKAILENVDRMRTNPPTEDETSTARRYLSDIFAIRIETLGAIADLVATQEALHLPDGYWDAYRTALRGTTPADVAGVLPQVFGEKRLIVVAGDADVIGADLSRFGDVDVLDPEKDFTKIKTLTRVSK